MTELLQRDPMRHQQWLAEAESPLSLPASAPQPPVSAPVQLPLARSTQPRSNHRRPRNPVTLICQSMSRLDEWEVSPMLFKHCKTGLELQVTPGWLTLGFSENSDVCLPLSLWDRWCLMSAAKRLASAKVAEALVGGDSQCPITALCTSLELRRDEWQVYPDVIANERAGIELITSEGMLFLRFGMYSRLRFPISLTGRVRLWSAIKRRIRDDVSRQFLNML